jgi:Protein of unknown function (DUF1571)
MLKRLPRGLIALAALAAWASAATQAAQPPVSPEAEKVVAVRAMALLEPKPAPLLTKSALIEIAETRPLDLWKVGLDRYDHEVRDYACVFTKQERIAGKLKPAEEIAVRFRREPHSVYMTWQKNEDQVKRALFIDRSDFVNSSGEKVAKVEPAGVLIRLIVSETTIPIHGKSAREASRRTIDEFGFKSTLTLLEHYNTLGQKNGELDFRYEGEDQIDGRPTFRFVRYLPFEKRPTVYPDAKMIIHLDQEWLLPTAVYSYADHAGTQLLASYVYSKLRMNPGLTEQDFRF